VSSHATPTPAQIRSLCGGSGLRIAHERRQIDGRRLDVSAAKPSASHESPAAGARGTQALLALARDRDGETATLARVLAELAGFRELAGEERAALIAQVAGPQAECPRRAVALDQAWAARRHELLAKLEALHKTPEHEQAERLRALVHTPSEHFLLLESADGIHVILVAGERPDSARLSYGRLPIHLSQRSFWGVVQSPDPCIAKGWPRHGYLAEQTYSGTLFRCTLDEQRRLIEAIERGFAVNHRRAEPRRTRGASLKNAAVFGNYVRWMILIFGRRTPSGNVVAEAPYRGGVRADPVF
jgi:hypothetical protein